MTGRRVHHDQLTPREQIVVMLLVQRLSYREIGHAMCISPKTVGNYTWQIYAKLGVAGRYELIDLIEESAVVFLREMALSIGAQLCAESR